MIDKIIERLENLKCSDEDAAREFDCAMRNVHYDVAINIVREVGEQGSWIKCSDEIPDDEVIACNTRGTQMMGYISEDSASDTGYKCESDGEHIYDCIAWQPLPQPYKEEV